VPTTPPASDVVVIEGGGVTVIVVDADLVVFPTKVAVTVAVAVPEAGATYVTEVGPWLVNDPCPVKVHVTP
jgi:hypothetical protein